MRRLIAIALVSLVFYAPASLLMGYMEGRSGKPIVNSGDCRIVNVLALSRQDGTLIYSLAYTPDIGEQRHVYAVLPGKTGRLDLACPSCAVYAEQGTVSVRAGKVVGVKIKTSNVWEAFHFLTSVIHAQGVLWAAKA